MEVQVLVQGPDTLHPIVVQVPEGNGEDPLRVFTETVERGDPFLRIGQSSFRTERVLAVIVRATFVEPPGRGAW